MASMQSEVSMDDSAADAVLDEAEQFEAQFGATEPSIAKQPTPDWLDKKHHPALANPCAGASAELKPVRSASAGGGLASCAGSLSISGAAAAPAAGAPAATSSLGAGGAEPTGEETDEEEGDDFNDDAFLAFAKKVRYQAIDVDYYEKIDDQAINFFMVKENEFKKAGLTFFECKNVSSGKITISSLTKALKESKKPKKTITTMTMSQLAASSDDDDDDDDEEVEEPEEANSDEEADRYADYPPLNVDGLNKPYLNLMKASQDQIDNELGNRPNSNSNPNPNRAPTPNLTPTPTPNPYP